MIDKLPQRHTIRLADYDYSCEGLYFITICCKDKVCHFGEIVNGEMILNDAGKIAKEEWLRTSELRNNIELREFIFMPNHMHGIIEITDVGANCIRPQTILGVCDTPLQEEYNKFRSPSNTIGSIIRGYKSAVAKQINKLYKVSGTNSIWQRNYYEHIIRNDQSYQQITEYIINNPFNWEHDKYYNN